MSFIACCVCDEKGLRDDFMMLPDPKISGIHGKKRITFGKRPAPELFHLFRQTLANVGNSWFRNGFTTKSLCNSGYFTGRDTIYYHLGHSCNQCRFAAGIVLKELRLKGFKTMPGNTKSNCANTCNQVPFSVPITIIGPFIAAFIRFCLKLLVWLAFQRLIQTLSIKVLKNSLQSHDIRARNSSWLRVILIWAIWISSLIMLLWWLHYTWGSSHMALDFFD